MFLMKFDYLSTAAYKKKRILYINSSVQEKSAKISNDIYSYI